LEPIPKPIQNHQGLSRSFSMIRYPTDCSKYEIQNSDFEFRDRLLNKQYNTANKPISIETSVL